MKKLFLAGLVSVLLHSAFAEDTCIIPPICDVRDFGIGLQFGLVTVSKKGGGIALGGYNETRSYIGIQVGAVNDSFEFYGIQASALTSSSSRFYGLQCAPANYTTYLKGIHLGVFNKIGHDSSMTYNGILQVGVVNDVGTSFAGLQVGVMNSIQASLAGVQLGVYNQTHNGDAIQVGIINECEFSSNNDFLVQIGLVNISRHSQFTVLPIIRIAW